ncbi:MAG: glycoside hydrolase family 25 protein [Oscillospiraceae bacterium]
MANNPLTLPCVILSAACALSLCCSISLTAQRFRQPVQPIESADGAQSAEQSVPAQTAEAVEDAQTTEAPEDFVPARDLDVVYIYDNGIDSFEYPVIEGAKLSDWNMSLLQSDEETKRRVLLDDEGNPRTRFGIDVSSYQGLIDWEKVAADGVEFAFLRAGYRGYETGKIVEDARFRRNLELAQAAGIDVGVYFFSQAISAEEGEEEADFVLSLLEQYETQLQLPIVFDWEHPSDWDPARTDNLSGEEQTAACLAFCERVRQAGFEPCYYTTLHMALFRYDLAKLCDIPMWLAEYTGETTFPYAYEIWQYSCSGVIDGIETLTDINIMTLG